MGVNEELSPSLAWPMHTGVVSNPEPLLEWMDSWKSAQDHPAVVDDLIQELQAGFIAHVPGGVTELKHQYHRTFFSVQRQMALARSFIKPERQLHCANSPN